MLIGRNTLLRSDKVWLSSIEIEISDSNTPRMHTLKEELFKYCPVGLTGSSISSSNPSIIFEYVHDFFIELRYIYIVWERKGRYRDFF